MSEKLTFAEKVLQFNENISHAIFQLPDGYKIINPYKKDTNDIVKKITTAFYQKYYNDTNPRRLIIGSSPARRGSAVTGVPFEDAKHIQMETGIFIDNYYINKSSSDFLFDVMKEYGGCIQFYQDFYMNFVFPLGIVKINSNHKEVNCNYYENKNLQKALTPFIVQSLRSIIHFGIDTSVCYCIGSGENYGFLLRINQEYHFFEEIIPLEHPRFIMQYNSKRKNEYIDKYLSILRKS